MDAGLYIVATPIGNLGDISMRALDVLKAADVIMAEDTRHSRKLLSRYEISTPLQSCHKFNEASKVEAITSAISGGQKVALVTDSGMPAVSDPGARVVKACRNEGLPVTVLPGASAVTSAVALSGFGGDRFLFEGFLKPKAAARKRRLQELEDAAYPVVLFESPHRILKLLTDVHEVLGERPIFVGRELTKRYEECLGGSASDVLKSFEGRAVKGEFVVVISPARKKRGAT